MGDEHESEPFNDVIRDRLSDTQRRAREVLFPTTETEPAEAGEHDEEIEDR